MTWALLVVIAIGLILTYIIWQETRSHLHWRELVAAGNVWAIRQLVSAEIERWHRIRPPGGVPVSLWAGVQSVELVAVGRDHIQVACGAEAEYRMAGGRREQVLSPLEAAMRLAAKLTEMLLYDIPEVKTDIVRVDVYSTVGGPAGTTDQRCILTTTATRLAAGSIDWDTMSARQIVDALTHKYETDEQGRARAIDPGPPLEDEAADDAPPGAAETRPSTGSKRRDGRH